MPNLIEKEKCVGCTACVSICPVKCLEMLPDEFGFSYPKLKDGSKCLDCHLCEKVCPVFNKQEKTMKLPKAYAAFSLNRTIQDNSSSGGIFTEISLCVLRQNGIVYGAAYDEDWKVKHIAVEQVDELYKLRGAKYSESILGNVFTEIKEHLQNGKLVLFSGTPCQVEGLKTFLNKKYENLICLDFVCHGIPSPMAWTAYIESHKTISNSKPVSINQRSKSTGWSRYSYSCEIEYEDGTKYSEQSFNDLYMKLYCNDYISRKSCSTCDFKGYNRSSDITIGDFWGIWDIDQEMDNGMGTSLVLIHSTIGMNLFYKIQDHIKFKNVELKDVERENPSLLYASREKIERSTVLNTIKDNRFNELWNFFPVSSSTELPIWKRVARRFVRIIRSAKVGEKKK